MGDSVQILSFGECELDFGRSELRRAGRPVDIQPTPLRVLLYVAQHRDRTVSRQELFDAVWPGVVVGDDALTRALMEVRRTVGDDVDAQRVIRTLKGLGYRFVAEARVAGGSGANVLEAAPPDEASALERRRSRTRAWLALGAAGLAIAALTAAFVLYGRAGSAPAKAAPPHMLAVIPFPNLSGGTALDPLADGLTADISEALQPPAILVPSTTMLGFKNKVIDVRDLRRTLGATHVLQGTVQAASDRVRVTIQLRETTGAHLSWSETYEQPRGDLLAAQSAITSRVAAVVPFLLPFTPTQDPDLAPIDNAIDFGMGLLWTFEPGALSVLEGVLARDPDNLRAHAFLPVIWSELQRTSKRSPEEAIAKMRWHAAEARRIAPGSKDAHAAAAITFIAERNWAPAEREARAACDLSTPRTALHCFHLRLVLLSTGRARQASEISRGQLEVFPNSAYIHINLGFELCAQRMYADAERAWARAEQLEPRFTELVAWARWLAGYPDDWVVGLRLLLVQLGDQAAVEEMDRINESKGWKAVARWAADHAEQLDPLEPPSSHRLVAAIHYAMAGEEEGALAALESTPFSTWFPPTLVSPFFDGLRDHPRFQAIVEAQGLTAYHAKYLRREPGSASGASIDPEP